MKSISLADAGPGKDTLCRVPKDSKFSVNIRDLNDLETKFCTISTVYGMAMKFDNIPHEFYLQGC